MSYLLLLYKSRHWELFCKTTFRQKITKIVTIFLTKLGLIFNTVYSKRKFFILLKMKPSTGIFLALRSRNPSGNFPENLFFFYGWECLLPIISFINVIKKLSRWNRTITHQIMKEKLKQLTSWNCCLVSSNGCSMLYLVSFKSWMYYSIALKCFCSSTQISDDQNDVCLFPNYV